MKKRPPKPPVMTAPVAYTGLIGGIRELVERARHTTALWTGGT
jgi:hypothetical protein